MCGIINSVCIPPGPCNMRLASDILWNSIFKPSCNLIQIGFLQRTTPLRITIRCPLVAAEPGCLRKMKNRPWHRSCTVIPYSQAIAALLIFLNAILIDNVRFFSILLRFLRRATCTSG